MYDDYLRGRYQEEYPKVDLFPGTNRVVRQRQQQRQQQRQPQRRSRQPQRRQSLATDTVRARNDANTRKQFRQLQGTSDSIHTSCKAILKSMEQILGLVTIVGLSLMGCFKYLDNINSRYDNDYAPEGEYSGKSTGKMSKEGKEMLIRDEGMRLEAYQDHKGIWTIGVGHTGKVDGKPIGPGMKITEEKARQLLDNDIKVAEDKVNRVVKYPISQRWFDALVNFVYVNGHLEGTKLLAAINRGDFAEAKRNLSIEQAHEPRMKRWRDYVAQDMTSDGKLKSDAEVIGQTSSAGAIRKFTNGSKVGNYTMSNPAQQRNYIALSERAESYLRDVGGTGLVTSGAEGTHGKGTVSHGSGNKIDVAARVNTDEEWANTAIPFIRNKNTAYVNFEDFSDARFEKIKALIIKKDPSLKDKCNAVKVPWSFDKRGRFLFNYYTGGGLHLDIGIRPDAYSKKQAKAEQKEQESTNPNKAVENNNKIKEQEKQKQQQSKPPTNPPQAQPKEKKVINLFGGGNNKSNKKMIDTSRPDGNSQIKAKNTEYRNARKDGF